MREAGGPEPPPRMVAGAAHEHPTTSAIPIASSPRRPEKIRARGQEPGRKTARVGFLPTSSATTPPIAVPTPSLNSSTKSSAAGQLGGLVARGVEQRIEGHQRCWLIRPAGR